jgi:hypothetical protein
MIDDSMHTHTYTFTSSEIPIHSLHSGNKNASGNAYPSILSFILYRQDAHPFPLSQPQRPQQLNASFARQQLSFQAGGQ